MSKSRARIPAKYLPKEVGRYLTTYLCTYVQPVGTETAVVAAEIKLEIDGAT